MVGGYPDWKSQLGPGWGRFLRAGEGVNGFQKPLRCDINAVPYISGTTAPLLGDPLIGTKK